MAHAISPRVQEALECAIVRDDIGAIVDAFVEVYVLAQAGMGNVIYAQDVDDVCEMILRHKVEL